MKDWVGLWYRLSKERGHSDITTLFMCDSQQHSLENFSFSHEKMDGFAALMMALQKMGFSTENFTCKFQTKPLSLPPWYKKPFLFLRGLGSQSPTPVHWKHFQPQVHLTPSLSWLIFSKRATRKLAQWCGDQKISVNAFLMLELTKTLACHLGFSENEFKGTWLMPVNLRSAVQNNLDVGNVVSFFPIHFDQKKSYGDIHKQIQNGFQSFTHWSNWYVAHIGRAIGFGGMRWLSKRAAQKSFWLGSFTDLGDCTPKADSEYECLKDKYWVLAPPGSPNYPIGCGSVTWFERRSLSLKIHPSVCSDIPHSSSEQILKDLRMRLHEILEINEEDCQILESAHRF